MTATPLRLASFGSVRKVNASQNTVEVVASTENIARDDAIIRASAWTVNGGLDRYRRNPVVLLAHLDSAPPIARATRVGVVNKELTATIEFDTGDPAAMDIFRKVKSGFMSAVSVRWIPHKSSVQRIGNRSVLVFEDVELLEMSFVSLPADADALAIRDGTTQEVVNMRTLTATLTGGGSSPAPRTGATDGMRTAYERAWTRPNMGLVERNDAMRASFELAGIVLGAAAAVKQSIPRNAGIPGIRWTADTASPEFLAAWRAHVLEQNRPVVIEGRAGQRAMDSQETGYGLELVGTSFEDSLWVAARSSDLLLASVDHVQAPRGGHTIATSSGILEMSIADESTTDSASAYENADLDTGKQNGTGTKFTIQGLVSGELDEDSIIPLVPTLRRQYEESFRLHLGSAYLNGDTTATATGNINLNDAQPAATKHYLAFNGMRHAYLVEATGQGYDAASGTVDQALIDRLRTYLSADIAESIEALGQDFGAVADDLLMICDRYSLKKVTDLSAFTPAERITHDVRPGEAGRVNGIRVFAPSYCVRTGSDGKIVEAADGTFGQLTMINSRGWKGVQTGGLRFYLDRVQRTDQYILEMYTRQNLHRHSNTAVAGTYGLVV
ncbi:MAG: hypothetical protein AB7J35_00480 [Dehalococcoidia bacterium]